jgi:hypothetical protein
LLYISYMLYIFTENLKHTIMNEALANRLASFFFLKENADLTREEISNEFQRILDVEFKERIEHTRKQTIRNCIKKLELLSNEEDN